MPVPSTPTNFYLQQGNGQTLCTCDLMSGATTYPVWRSSDGVSFSNVASPAVPLYLDTTVSVGTQYYYYMTAANGSGPSVATATQSIIPSLTAIVPLGAVRLMAQQEADRVGSNFVTVPEWNNYINNSYFELYDLLVDTYEDYFITNPVQITLNGAQSYALPNGVNYSGAPALYKLAGVDLGINSGTNAWVTLKKFEFISRNRYIYPQLTSTYLGVFNLRYRLVGSNIMFIPTPSAGQIAQIWYTPRLTRLLKDTDMLDGISGWDEYVVVDAALKALGKEESGTQELMMRKAELLKRIEDSAPNRDAGIPDKISDVRSSSELWGGYGSVGGDGPMGGF